MDNPPFGLEVVDLHIEGVILRSYVRLDPEFMVTLSGGEGYWVDLDTATRIEFKEIADLALTFQYMASQSHDMEAVIAVASDSMEQIFERWQSQETPLTIVSGPNAPLFIIEDENMWLAVPRRKD